MAEEHSIDTATIKNIPQSAINDFIAATFNNLVQYLATLLTRNQKNIAPSSHNPILDPFSYTQPFDLSYHSGYTKFHISCATLDVTWEVNEKTSPLYLSQSRRNLKIYIGTTEQIEPTE